MVCVAHSDSEEDRPDREPDLGDRGRGVLQAHYAGGALSGREPAGQTAHAANQTHRLQCQRQPAQDQGSQSQCFQGTEDLTRAPDSIYSQLHASCLFAQFVAAFFMFFDSYIIWPKNTIYNIE